MSKNLKAYHGYESYSIRNFKFLERFHLKPYHDEYAPLVLFGCYRPKDREIVRNHKGILIIRWCGADSKRAIFKELMNPDIIHVTPLPNVRRHLKNKGINCHQIKLVSREKNHSMILGNKVYAYINKNHPTYYGNEVIKKLNITQELLIGDYSIPQKDWYAGRCDEYYSQIFIGLALSEYAGGGGSIIEMGLRGIKVVTNVLDMPHTIPWETVDDIEQAIEKESKNIGKVNKKLAQQVYDSMVHDLDCFDLGKLLNDL